MKYRYYYNTKKGETPWRNNLVYTSLMSDDNKVFVQWFCNDTDYHKGANQVVDPALMEEKWNREVKYLLMMYSMYPQHVPEILDIDYSERKIYLAVQGVDFWQISMDRGCGFNEVLPEWESQMLEIVSAHRKLNLFKYSMHPSSYFIVDGKLKSINYFFTYHSSEGKYSIKSHQSHISANRQLEMKALVEKKGIDWETPQDQSLLQELCFNSFRNNYPNTFIDSAIKIYKN